MIVNFQEAKGTDEGKQHCANVKNIGKINKNNDNTNIRMFHSVCKHCKYPKKPQWLDIENSAMITANLPPDSERLGVDLKSLRPVEACMLEGIEVGCPHKPKEFLAKWYGANFETPYYSKWNGKQWVKNEAVADRVKDNETKRNKQNKESDKKNKKVQEKKGAESEGGARV